MEALKILRKHMEGHYLFSNEVSSEQLVEFQKSLVSAMEEYAELRLSNVVGQSKQLPCEHDYQTDITCGVDITACTKCGDVI